MKSGHLNNLTEKLYSGNFLSRAGKYLRKAGLAALLTATVGIGYVGCEKEPERSISEERLYQQSKIAFVSERDGNKEIKMSTKTEHYVRAAKLADVQTVGCKVVLLEGHTVALFAHKDKISALDNRCPHMGFPPPPRQRQERYSHLPLASCTL